MFQVPDNELIIALKGILGDTNVLTSELEPYGSDYTEDFYFPPSVVAIPADSKEIAAVLALCNSRNIPVYTRGAGTGLSGGALPVYPGVVLLTKRLNKILHIDLDNFQATVEPGVINEHFRNAVEALGLFYPPDPASKGSCSLGGNIAHGSGGPKAVKYGTTKDYVLNLEVVLPDGNIIWTGANTVKNSTGFNLTQLMVGSEGLLGVVTKIVFRLLAKPKHDQLFLIPFAEAAHAAKTVNAVLLSGVTPSSLELMESSGVEISSRVTQTPFPMHPGATFYMLLELDGDDPAKLFEDAEKLLPLLESCGALDVLHADNAELKEQWWKVRRSIGETVKSASVYKEEDTVVPRAALPELLANVKRIGAKYGFESVCYGHAGDGNLHVNILKNNLSDQAWKEEVPKGIREIFEVCRELGGTISGEHGVGLVQAQFLDVMFQESHMKLMRGIKSAFDPKHILNPGKWV